MRALFAGIFVTLIAGMCFAQSGREVQPVPDSGRLFQVNQPTPGQSLKFDPLPLVPDQTEASTKAAEMREGILRPNAGCFAMRTYQFSRGSAGAAPKLMGYMTCVPSKSLQLKQTAPKVRFVPQ